MLIPSIDLMDGRAVQLRQGREKILEHDNPLQLARDFNRVGEVAVIDLDAALDQGQNNELLAQIFPLARCRAGGGIRTPERARELINMGAEKIIIGTRAFSAGGINKEFLNDLRKILAPEQIVIALDVREGKVQTHGWTRSTGMTLEQVLPPLREYAGEFLVTCIDREGTMTGTDMDLLNRATDLAPGRITAAGGISSLEQIQKLSRREIKIQLGMALYSGKISLEEAFIATLNWDQGLIPTISRDRHGQVLMLAYSSRESLLQTLKTNKMCYYSRSRKKLWTKGETSGHFQELISLRSDCDGDALLATVDQSGSACHQEKYSCFGSRTFSPSLLQDIIQSRLENAPPQSYTASLDGPGVREKIREESEEIIMADDRDNLTWEAADLLYHLLVLLSQEDVDWMEVLTELKRRHRK